MINRSIRFAAPPTGNLRFQAPQAPEVNRSATIPATQYAATCPQSGSSNGIAPNPQNETGVSEDCLFVCHLAHGGSFDAKRLQLNVWTPSNASKPLPVYVWIHGGMGLLYLATSPD
jgi:carboxylesterase type B